MALEDVTKRYGDVVALEDVSLELGEPGLHCLLGPNGSGKTTMFRLLTGLERPTEGTIRRNGGQPGCGFQRPRFYPSLSVEENIAVFGRLQDAADEDWRDTLVDRLQLGPALHRRAGDVSGGFARKLDLVLAFLDRPPVVFLDEPLGALDDVSRTHFLEFVADYCEDGHAVVVSTHRVTAFEPALDRLTIVDGGTIVEDRRRAELDSFGDGALQEQYVELVRGRTAE